MTEKHQTDRQQQEADWVARTLAGDQRAFEALVRRYQAPLGRMLRAMVRNPQDAEDLLQETFLRAFRFLHRFDQTRPFGPWILRIGGNLARNHLRRRRVRAEVALDESPGEEEERFEGEWLADMRTMAEIEHRELLAQTRRAMEELPAEQRVVLEMRILGEMSYQEIAEMLTIPIGTVMSRLNRGRHAIQRALREYAQRPDGKASAREAP